MQQRTQLAYTEYESQRLRPSATEIDEAQPPLVEHSASNYLVKDMGTSAPTMHTEIRTSTQLSADEQNQPRFDHNHYSLVQKLKDHPTRHLAELKLVSLLSSNPQLKLTLRESLKKFPQGTAQVLTDSVQAAGPYEGSMAAAGQVGAALNGQQDHRVGQVQTQGAAISAAAGKGQEMWSNLIGKYEDDDYYAFHDYEQVLQQLDERKKMIKHYPKHQRDHIKKVRKMHHQQNLDEENAPSLEVRNSRRASIGSQARKEAAPKPRGTNGGRSRQSLPHSATRRREKRKNRSVSTSQIEERVVVDETPNGGIHLKVSCKPIALHKRLLQVETKKILNESSTGEDLTAMKNQKRSIGNESDCEKEVIDIKKHQQSRQALKLATVQSKTATAEGTFQTIVRGDLTELEPAKSLLASAEKDIKEFEGRLSSQIVEGPARLESNMCSAESIPSLGEIIQARLHNAIGKPQDLEQDLQQDEAREEVPVGEALKGKKVLVTAVAEDLKGKTSQLSDREGQDVQTQYLLLKSQNADPATVRQQSPLNSMGQGHPPEVLNEYQSEISMAGPRILQSNMAQRSSKEEGSNPLQSSLGLDRVHKKVPTMGELLPSQQSATTLKKDLFSTNDPLCQGSTRDELKGGEPIEGQQVAQESTDSDQQASHDDDYQINHQTQQHLLGLESNSHDSNEYRVTADMLHQTEAVVQESTGIEFADKQQYPCRTQMHLGPYPASYMPQSSTGGAQSQRAYHQYTTGATRDQLSLTSQLSSGHIEESAIALLPLNLDGVLAPIAQPISPATAHKANNKYIRFSSFDVAVPSYRLTDHHSQSQASAGKASLTASVGLAGKSQYVRKGKPVLEPLTLPGAPSTQSPSIKTIKGLTQQTGHHPATSRARNAQDASDLTKTTPSQIKIGIKSLTSSNGHQLSQKSLQYQSIKTKNARASAIFGASGVSLQTASAAALTSAGGGQNQGYMAETASRGQQSMFGTQPHHKISAKAESYSKKGFGNGFVSVADRFSGVDEKKFQVNKGLFLRQQFQPTKPSPATHKSTPYLKSLTGSQMVETAKGTELNQDLMKLENNNSKSDFTGRFDPRNKSISHRGDIIKHQVLMAAQKRRNQRPMAPGKLPNRGNTFGAGELEQMTREVAIHVTSQAGKSQPETPHESPTKALGHTQRADYHQEKFAQEKSFVPGPGHYEIQIVEDQKMQQSLLLAEQRRRIADEKRVKSVTAVAQRRQNRYTHSQNVIGVLSQGGRDTGASSDGASEAAPGFCVISEGLIASAPKTTNKASSKVSLLQKRQTADSEHLMAYKTCSIDQDQATNQDDKDTLPLTQSRQTHHKHEKALLSVKLSSSLDFKGPAPQSQAGLRSTNQLAPLIQATAGAYSLSKQSESQESRSRHGVVQHMQMAPKLSSTDNLKLQSLEVRIRTQLQTMNASSTPGPGKYETNQFSIEGKMATRTPFNALKSIKKEQSTLHRPPLVSNFDLIDQRQAAKNRGSLRSNLEHPGPNSKAKSTKQKASNQSSAAKISKNATTFKGPVTEQETRRLKVVKDKISRYLDSQTQMKLNRYKPALQINHNVHQLDPFYQKKVVGSPAQKCTAETLAQSEPPTPLNLVVVKQLRTESSSSQDDIKQQIQTMLPSENLPLEPQHHLGAHSASQSNSHNLRMVINPILKIQHAERLSFFNNGPLSSQATPVTTLKQHILYSEAAMVTPSGQTSGSLRGGGVLHQAPIRGVGNASVAHPVAIKNTLTTTLLSSISSNGGLGNQNYQHVVAPMQSAAQHQQVYDATTPGALSSTLLSPLAARLSKK